VDLKLQLSLDSRTGDNDMMLNKIDALYQAMKRSLGGLRPSGIDTLPIENVIQRSEIITTLKHANISYSFDVIGKPVPFDADQKIHIYRIIQEAVTNSIKYANAKTLSIEANYEQHRALFVVTDDGEGIFEHLAHGGNAAPSMGLLSMKERAKLINGVLDISQIKPSGTRVCLTLPYSSC